MATHSVKVFVGADVTQAEKAFKQISKQMTSLGKDMTKWGKSMTVGVTLPIVGLGAGLIKAASDAEETNSKFKAVFKDQATEVDKWATAFSRSVGRSVVENKGFLATIQDTLVPLGFARDAAADMSEQVVQLATDLGSFNNLPTDQVVRDIQSAIVGNTETLRKYGVVANQAEIIQEALNSGLIKNKNEITPLTKAQAILQLTMKGTADAQGDAKRTAGEFANQLRSLKADSTDLAANLGKQLIPAALDVVGWAKSGVQWFGDLSEETQKNVLQFAALAAAIGPVLLIGGKTLTMFGSMHKTLAPIAGALKITALQFYAMTAAVGVLVYMLQDFWTASERTQKQIRKTQSILGTGGGLTQDLQDYQEGFYDQSFDSAADKAADVMDEIRKEGEKLAEDMRKIMGDVAGSVGNVVPTINVPSSTSVVTGNSTSMDSGIGASMSTPGGISGSVLDIGAGSSLTQSADIGTDSLDDFNNNLESTGTDFLSGIKDIFDTFGIDLDDSVSNALDIAQKLFSEDGILSQVFGENTDTLLSGMGEFGTNLLSGLGDVLGSIGSGVGGLLGGLFGFAEGGWVTEPVVGVGLRSGAGYSFAERGPELVSNTKQLGVSGAGTVEVRANFYGDIRTEADIDEILNRIGRQVAVAVRGA